MLNIHTPFSTGSHEAESLIKVQKISGSIRLAVARVLLNFL